MKSSVHPVMPDTENTEAVSDPTSVASRIQLLLEDAFLDDYACEKRGYDPYDSSKGRLPDVWATKRKRA